ncbi:GGDEF domain-containing protein, partial [Vibrio anguillarum]
RQHLYFNQTFVKELGYTIQDIPDISTWFTTVYPDPEYRQEVALMWEKEVHASMLANRQIAEIPALIKCGDGLQRWFTVSAQIKAECQPNWHIVTFQNIHQLKASLEEVLHISNSDPLTHLTNRRGLEYWIEDRELGCDVGVIMLDIDHFKSINDNFGHMAGDQLLCTLANILWQSTSIDACCVRWGGEEFLVALPGASPQEVIAMANKIRYHIASFGFYWQGKLVPVTVSAGCTTGVLFDGLDSLIQKADVALYQAKLGGRNQVVCFD